MAIAELRVNGYIRAREVRVVAPDGGQIGIKKLQEALWLAEQLGLDLVEVAPSANPPVCRLMDYGKYKYEQSVKSREARKNQTRTVIKEVKFKPKIGQHDYEIKRNRVLKFLEHGDRVKITIWFRGREMSRPELGLKIIDRLVEEIGDAAKIEQAPRQEGRNMHMVLVPVRQKKVVRQDEGADVTEETVPVGAVVPVEGVEGADTDAEMPGDAVGVEGADTDAEMPGDAVGVEGVEGADTDAEMPGDAVGVEGVDTGAGTDPDERSS